MTSTPTPEGASGDDAVGQAGRAESHSTHPASDADGHGGGSAPDAVATDDLHALTAAVQSLSAHEVWRLSDAELALVLQRVEVERRRLAMVQVAVAAEARTRGLPRRAGFGPGPQVKDGDTAALTTWVRSLVNVTRADARLIAEVGAALFLDPVATDLDETRAAAASGQIAPQHVAAIADALTRLAPPHLPVDPSTGEPVVDEATRRDAQRVLVEHACVLDPTQTRVVAKRAVAVLDPGAGERLAKDEDARDELRRLSFTPDGSGLVHLRGVLTPTCAGLLATAIDAASAPRPASDGGPDRRSAAMRRHDGLQHVLGLVVAADGVLPSTHGSPYRLVVTVPHATLRAACASSVSEVSPSPFPSEPTALDVVEHAPVFPGLLPDGFPLSPLTAQTMACDADLVAVLVDDHHQPLDVGDTQYAFPPKVRTAIIARDGGCTYPGCGAPAPWCDCHHLVPFSRGGPTSVNNGALLCGRHHRYVHAMALTGRVVTRDGASHVQWNHRPTSWTATSATSAVQNRAAADGPSRHDTDVAGQAPALTDRCLDQLVQRWQRRRHQAGLRGRPAA